MLDKGMSLKFTNTYISLPYMCHIGVANVEATKILIKRGVTLNKSNVDCDTQLKLAASYGKLKIISYQTELDTDLIVRDCTNTIAFHSDVFSISVDR